MDMVTLLIVHDDGAFRQDHLPEDAATREFDIATATDSVVYAHYTHIENEQHVRINWYTRGVAR